MQALFVEPLVTTCECCSTGPHRATIAVRTASGKVSCLSKACIFRKSGKTWQDIINDLRLERDRRHQRAAHHLQMLRKAGEPIGVAVVREVASEYGAELSPLLNQWTRGAR